uniref:Thimet oligopeptidase n=1 Tax=Phallusia mammillata TaxID=59560 RepID=A0A6F9DUU6_9ASCI|nr:thimet oligopeptidase [Phallusia mammillata]
MLKIFIRLPSYSHHFYFGKTRLLKSLRFLNFWQISTRKSSQTMEFLQWNMTADEIASSAEKLMQDTRNVYDQVAMVPKNEENFNNTVKVVADFDSSSSIQRNNIDFFQHVHPDKTLRDASTSADKKISDFEVEMSMRQDVFDRIEAASKLSQQDCTPEGKRLLERMVKLGRRNGLHLDKTKQDKIKEIKKRMTEISIDFQKNLNEANETLSFSESELKGLPKDFMDSLEKDETGKFIVTLKYPHYFPLMKKCSVSSTRKAMETAFNSRCKENNTAILSELVKLRAEKAKLLGFENHAAFVHEMRMAKHPNNVKEFTDSLAKKLKPLGEADLTEMLAMKALDCKASGEEFNGKINMWDLRFYMTKIEEEKYSVDQNKLKEYFPLDVVTKGLLDIYQQLLDLKFERVENPVTWHSDVTLYTVSDATSGKLIGHFYLDLHPREGKYGHAACFGLVPGCLKPDGNRQFAVAAMVANFTKPTADAPSLLTHDEVETFFHEFGHVMHQICAEAEYEMFSGTSVERDFVEAPSQMLENWCWEAEPLRRMSKHYKDGGALPDNMIDTLVKSRNANTGVFYLRQITLGTLDLNIHMSDSADLAQVYADACQNILGIPATPGTCMPATFGHLAGGYDAQYYGYLWSEVFCFDMFYTRFIAGGIMSSAVGRDYREKILKPGGSLDATEMLRNFLGRDPKQDAFLGAKGLGEKFTVDIV